MTQGRFLQTAKRFGGIPIPTVAAAESYAILPVSARPLLQPAHYGTVRAVTVDKGPAAFRV